MHKNGSHSLPGSLSLLHSSPTQAIAIIRAGMGETWLRNSSRHYIIMFVSLGIMLGMYERLSGHVD
jgi:hypothetical protein